MLAPNPSPYTGPGTNTWILDSDGSVAIIDPGPIDASHARAIMERVGDRDVEAVLVTHTHEDHAPLANPLARDLGVPAFGYERGPGFDPDLRLEDGSVVGVGDLQIQVVHTPGHSDDHVCFLVDRILFTGDHIMGGSSVMVERMAPYLESLERLRRLDLEALHPGHGEVMANPNEVIEWYVAHRRQREREILRAVEDGAASVADIVAVVYRDVDHSLHPLAARSVRAHLEKLADDGRVVIEGQTVKISSEGSA